jgi:hypothetical protein
LAFHELSASPSAARAGRTRLRGFPSSRLLHNRERFVRQFGKNGQPVIFLLINLLLAPSLQIWRRDEKFSKTAAVSRGAFHQRV